MNNEQERKVKTYRYVKGTMGLFKPHDVSYEVTADERGRSLKIRKTFGNPKEIALGDARSTINFGGNFFARTLRKIFNIGNIDLSGSFGKETLKRVHPVRDF